MWIRRPSELALCACLLFGALDANAAPPKASQDDPMAEYRERFKQGMDRYQAGAAAEAIGYWEPIYRELGEQKGYRLAYNLGVAYQELGDATRAAERLQSFLAEVDARRGRGEALATIVQKEESDARSRIAGLVATKGRIQIEPGTPPRAAQIDASEPRLPAFVAWVTPGQHTVTFAPGTPDAEMKTVDVQAGQTVDVSPAPPAPPSAAPSVSPAPGPTIGTPPPPPPPPPLVRRETERPFSPALMAVTGGLALAAGITAVPLEEHAWSLRDRYTPPDATGRQNFDNARTWAYVAIGGAVGLATVTAALAAWYFFGTSTREVIVTPGGVAGRF